MGGSAVKTRSVAKQRLGMTIYIYIYIYFFFFFGGGEGGGFEVLGNTQPRRWTGHANLLLNVEAMSDSEVQRRQSSKPSNLCTNREP